MSYWKAAQEATENIDTYLHQRILKDLAKRGISEAEWNQSIKNDFKRAEYMSKFKGDEEFFNPKEYAKEMKKVHVDEEQSSELYEEAMKKREEMLGDAVNQPAHYKDGGIETIDFIEAKRLGYNLGNVVKYVSRAGKKDAAKELEDLKKAAWYLAREIKNLND